MTSTAKSDSRASALLPVVADRIDELMRTRRFKQEKVVKLYKAEARRRFPAEVIKFSRRKLCGILAQGTSRESRDRTRPNLNRYDLRILAAVFGTTLEDLTGGNWTEDRGVVYWDTKCNPEDDDKFKNALSEQLPHAVEMLSWAEFLPCSLETGPFMSGHHEAIFLDLGENTKDYRTAIDKYNNTGMSQRERLMNWGHNRPYIFSHMMFESDLAKIADKRAIEYQKCSSAMRRECLEGLRAFIDDPLWKLNLILVKDRGPSGLRRKVRALKRRLHDFDSVVVVFGPDGQGVFSFWRNHKGTIEWTEDRARIEQRQCWLEEFRDAASWRSDTRPLEVRQLLQYMIEKC